MVGHILCFLDNKREWFRQVPGVLWREIVEKLEGSVSALAVEPLAILEFCLSSRCPCLLYSCFTQCALFFVPLFVIVKSSILFGVARLPAYPISSHPKLAHFESIPKEGSLSLVAKEPINVTFVYSLHKNFNKFKGCQLTSLSRIQSILRQSSLRMPVFILFRPIAPSTAGKFFS
jgi:hypothetical protein